MSLRLRKFKNTLFALKSMMEFHLSKKTIWFFNNPKTSQHTKPKHLWTEYSLKLFTQLLIISEKTFFPILHIIHSRLRDFPWNPSKKKNTLMNSKNFKKMKRISSNFTNWRKTCSPLKFAYTCIRFIKRLSGLPQAEKAQWFFIIRQTTTTTVCFTSTAGWIKAYSIKSQNSEWISTEGFNGAKCLES